MVICPATVTTLHFHPSGHIVSIWVTIGLLRSVEKWLKRGPVSPRRSNVTDQVLAYDKLWVRLVEVNGTFIKDPFITKLLADESSTHINIRSTAFPAVYCFQTSWSVLFIITVTYTILTYGSAIRCQEVSKEVLLIILKLIIKEHWIAHNSV